MTNKNIQNQEGGEKRKIQTVDILGLGIDISKNKADICLKEHSKVLQRFVVTNDEWYFYAA